MNIQSSWYWRCLVVVGALITSSAAPGAPLSARVAAGLDAETVVGTVSFEKKSTIVPMTVCDRDLPCVKPESYWTLVIHDENQDFEVDEQFAKGSEKEPESLEVAGVVIRPGSRVVFRANVEKLSETYSLIHGIESAGLLMD